MVEPLDLEPIRKRELAAPRVPWTAAQTIKGNPAMLSLLGCEGSAFDGKGRTVFGEIAHSQAKQVAAFIAGARHDVPALVAEVERRRKPVRS